MAAQEWALGGAAQASKPEGTQCVSGGNESAMSHRILESERILLGLFISQTRQLEV